MNAKALIKLLQGAGFRGPALQKAWAIATRESGGRPDAFNGNTGTGDQSYGLFQINMLGSLGPARRRQYGLRGNADLLDPAINARVAYQMSKGGTDFGAWGIGPNAYHGAPQRAKQRYLELLKQFPGSKGGATEQPTGNTFGHQRTSSATSAVELAQADRQLTGDWLLERAAMRRAGQAIPFGAGLLALGERRRQLQRAYADQSQALSPVAPGAVPEPRNTTFSSPAGSVQLPTRWMGTHVTDGLKWGSKTAEDIMAKAGTAVLAPEDSEVVYFHPTGAQGGGSMLLRTASGREYWLGHIDQGLAAGSRVRRGQQLAIVSADHAHPHVHIDARNTGG